jgi:hypothetical protein
MSAKLEGGFIMDSYLARNVVKLGRKLLRLPAPATTQQDERWAREIRVPQGSRANPEDPDVLADFAFFAVVKTWMDEDVIEATVRNAFTQGVDSVFVVDNASTDSTLDRARAAGACIAEVFDYDRFDGNLIQTLVNGVVVRESLRSRASYVWWMYLDSDEFPTGPRGATVREYLASLDRGFRIAGATFLNHLPHEKPEYVPGFHPIDFQPYCYKFVGRWALECGHWKHPLQRFDRDRTFIVCKPGAHHAAFGDNGERWEPAEGIVVHHFQYRDEGRTRRKLELVCDAHRSRFVQRSQIKSFQVRMRSLDAVYSQRWSGIDTNSTLVLDQDTVAAWPYTDSVRRWYSPEELASAIDPLNTEPSNQLT